MKEQEQIETKIAALEKELTLKNRELEIEAALEKVRSRSLTMHSSDELKDVVQVVFDNLKELNFVLEDAAVAILLFEEGSRNHVQWTADPRQAYATALEVAYTDHSISASLIQARESGVDFFSRIFPVEEKNEYFNYLFAHSNYRNLPNEVKNLILESEQYGYSVAFAKKTAILLPTNSGQLVTGDQKETLKRFAVAFDQAYTRFLDLQKAEAQAREAQIELALERVRARTMAMQKSEELTEAAILLFQQAEALGLPVISCGYNIWEKEDTVCTAWMSDRSGSISPPFKIPLTESPSFIRFYESRQKGEQFYTEEVSGEALAAHYRYMLSLPNFAVIAEKFSRAGFALPTYQINHIANFSHGNLIFITCQPVPEAHDIFKRFAKVFGQTYTRFLDLQKAEAQAREAQIETALERVRARAMAMHTSPELQDVAKELRTQIALLGQNELDTCVIQLYEESPDYVHSWASMTPSDNKEEIREFNRPVPKKGLMIIEESLRAYSSGQKDYILVNEKEKSKQWMSFMKETYPDIYAVFIETMGSKPEQIPTYWSFSDFNGGSLLMVTLSPPADVSRILLRRFANVFGLAYRRFIDLKQAEAQAREAQIEVALEKVRSRSLAMHTSDELKDVIIVVFEKLKDLGVLFEGAGIQLFTEGSEDIVQWVAAPDILAAPILALLPYSEKDYNESEIVRDIWMAKARGENVYNKSYSFGEKNSFFEYAGRHNDFDQMPVSVREFQMQAPGYTISLVAEKHSALWVDSYSGQNISFEGFNVLKRIAKVFEQAYVRFLDLKQAEAQARESQIQLALERVRARTMAMQRSEELSEAASLLFEQVSDLGIKIWTTGFKVWSDDNNFFTDYVTNPQGGFMEPYTIDCSQYSVLVDVSNAKKRGDEFFVNYQEGEQLAETYRQLTKYGQKQFKAILDSGFQFPSKQHEHHVFGSKVSLLFITYEPVPDAHEIFKRFGKVFEQTYTRFLDLQKAESQAREGKIEAALEKVRSRSLAMHHSNELEQVVASLFDRLVELGLSFDGALIFTFDKEKRSIQLWIATVQLPAPIKIELPFDDEIENNAIIKDLWNAVEKGEHIFNKSYSGETKNDYFRYVQKYNEPKIPEPVRRIELEKETWTAYFVAEKNSMLGFDSWSGPITSLADDDFNVLRRFARVFEQAYVRFLDLQKAEAQAREAQIQLALERVRARTMAMQKSEELREIVAVVFQQMKKLGYDLTLCNILLFDPVTLEVDYWLSFGEQEVLPESYHVPYFNHPVYSYQLNAWKNRKSFDEFELSGSLKISWDEYIMTQTDIKKISVSIKEMMGKLQKVILSSVATKNGLLQVANVEPLSLESISILQRFAKVFEQTYTRFLDLQKAEAQAKEAKIEAALERVRSRSMAMQKSSEVMDVAVTVYDQLQQLDFSFGAATIIIMDKKTGNMEHWLAGFIQKSHIESYQVNNIEHPLHAAQLAAWREGANFISIELSGAALKSYAHEMFTQSGYRNLPEEEKAMLSEREHTVFNLAYMSHGALMWAPAALSDDNAMILQRFAKVFEQTYTRFLDLQRVEAQAKEVMRQASVDRVRAEIASMRTTRDLESITPLIWSELTTLCIPFIRCGVFILDEEQQRAHVYLSTPYGKAIAALTFPFNSNLQFIEAVIDNWRADKPYVEHWDRTRFNEWTHSLVAAGMIHDDEEYNAGAPPENLYLHFAPFLQGMLYVGNTTPLTNDDLQLIRSLAEAFSTAYARYEDFTRLEQAKKEIEITLSELKSTQAQLVQKEKMASLGELTAGIAHEIQNPLNFVNNFSEINTELIDELRNEIVANNKEEALLIANDIRENEHKINHHGKRADSIVKGMLQHSRASSGKKELTNINSLVDESLRLSYHGLRAKDKEFNAAIKTDLDDSIGNISVVPQDISRVLLNLFNNAFYAISEKKSKLNGMYDPSVTVCTKKLDGKVEIQVKDNGNGIPQNIVDKVFQPFFTTKPTGQGTGLGLSLSYDIVKAHGGEIRVESKEGEGAEFTFWLSL